MTNPRTECFIYHLRPGCGPRYDELHRDVWPEVQLSLREGGTGDYSIYRRNNLVITVLARSDQPAPPVDKEGQRRLDEWAALLNPLFARTTDVNGEPLYADLIFRL